MSNLNRLRFTAPVLALGLLGAAAPSHAQLFNRSETSAFCLAETIVSLFAVLAEDNGECPAVSGTVAIDGVAGTATVLTAGSTLDLRNDLGPNGTRGVFCDVNAEGSLAGVPVTEYNGYLPTLVGPPRTHAFNGNRTIFKSGATVRFGGIHFYDEHNIKNFRRVPGGPPADDAPLVCSRNYFEDDGLEVITKFGFPRSKWEQESQYCRPDGTDGFLIVEKEQITPAVECEIELDLFVANDGGTFTASGPVSVSPED